MKGMIETISNDIIKPENRHTGQAPSLHDDALLDAY
jgi:hypothetical protein